jgi:uncharacterized membrane protein YphA (DoxX/SURF4 family)
MDRSSAPYGYTPILKKYLENPFFLLGLRILVGLAFVVASIEKIADPAAFGASIANYRILPDSMVLIPATFLPWLELLCGFCLLFGLMVRGSGLLIASMLLVFTAALLYAMARGLDISCGCFSRRPGADAIGWWKIAVNLGLICASLLLLRGGEGALSLRGYIRDQSKANIEY